MRTVPPDEAARILAAGGLVAHPTDTCYGLGCDAHNRAAVEALLAAKGRSGSHSLLVMVDSREMAERYAGPFSGLAARLADACWPGALTLVVPCAMTGLPPAVCGSGLTIGLRLPACLPAVEMVRRLGRAVVTTSANLTGGPVATRSGEIDELFGDRIDALLDGPVPPGAVSTVVRLSPGGGIELLRPGAVPFVLIESLRVRTDRPDAG